MRGNDLFRFIIAYPTPRIKGRADEILGRCPRGRAAEDRGCFLPAEAAGRKQQYLLCILRKCCYPTWINGLFREIAEKNRMYDSTEKE
jgi:hypothetical protein